MSEKFDPYYKWLGIPAKSRPPTHYRLLGIEPLESDREVIDSAANRLMAYLKTLSAGEDSTPAQRLLNEAAIARRCLLDSKLKAEYDAQLGIPNASLQSAAAPLRGAAGSEKFDPYYKWLGIPPKDQPPTHYRLLGIEPFESDREVVESAANRIMAYLKTLSTGDDTTPAQRLLNEAALARRCLLDPPAKAKYDARLRTSIALPPPAGLFTAKPISRVPRTAAANAASPESGLADSSTATVGAARKRRAQERIKATRQNQQNVLIASIAACVVIAVVWIGIAVSSNGRTADHPASLAAAPRTNAKNSPEAATTTSIPANSPKKLPAPTSIAAQQDDKPEQVSSNSARIDAIMESPLAAKLSADTSISKTKPPTAEVAALSENIAVKRSSQVAAAKPPVSLPPAPPGDPFAKLPAVLDLPAYPKLGAEVSAVNLGSMPVVDLKNAKFALLGADQVFGLGAKATVTAVDPANPGRWRVELREHGDDPLMLAEFRVRAGQLQFSWVQNTKPFRADLLRNCLLKISADQHEHFSSLRQPLAVSPLTIQNEKGRPQTRPIQVRSIPSGLPYRIEIDGVSGPAPYYAEYHPPRENSEDKITDLKWSDPASPLPIYAQISLDSVTGGSFVIRTGLLLQPPDEKNPKPGKVFNSRSGEDLIKSLALAIKQYDANHPRTLAVQRGIRPDPQAIAQYESQNAAQHNEQLRQINHLQRLDALSDKNLRESVRIHIKIYTTIAGRRLELVRTVPELPVKK